MTDIEQLPRTRCIDSGVHEIAGRPNLRIMRDDEGWWEAFEGADHGFGVEWHPLAGVPRRTLREAVATYFADGGAGPYEWGDAREGSHHG